MLNRLSLFRACCRQSRTDGLSGHALVPISSLQKHQSRLKLGIELECFLPLCNGTVELASIIKGLCQVGIDYGRKRVQGAGALLFVNSLLESAKRQQVIAVPLPAQR